jgi:hypothetical protein
MKHSDVQEVNLSFRNKFELGVSSVLGTVFTLTLCWPY